MCIYELTNGRIIWSLSFLCLYKFEHNCPTHFCHTNQSKIFARPSPNELSLNAVTKNPRRRVKGNTLALMPFFCNPLTSYASLSISWLPSCWSESTSTEPILLLQRFIFLHPGPLSYPASPVQPFGDFCTSYPLLPNPCC